MLARPPQPRPTGVPILDLILTRVRTAMGTLFPSTPPLHQFRKKRKFIDAIPFPLNFHFVVEVFFLQMVANRLKVLSRSSPSLFVSLLPNLPSKTHQGPGTLISRHSVPIKVGYARSCGFSQPRFNDQSQSHISWCSTPRYSPSGPKFRCEDPRDESKIKPDRLVVVKPTVSV